MNTASLGNTKGLSLVIDFICFKKIASQFFSYSNYAQFSVGYSHKPLYTVTLSGLIVLPLLGTGPCQSPKLPPTAVDASHACSLSKIVQIVHLLH